MARILVVDDDPFNRDVLSRRLQHHGHGVDVAEGGAQALQAAQDTAYDLVLLDIMMPGMDGHQVLSAFKDHDRLAQVPVMMISALEDTDTVVRCLSSGAEDYLTKPFNPHILRARVDSALARKRLRDMEQQHARSLERELEIGRQIQLGFLPAELPHVEGWQVAARFRPARQVAGDFYDLFPVPGAGLGVVIADVCDKGVGAALYMALFRSLLRSGAIRGPSASVDPASTVLGAMSQTNDYIATVHERANMFATVFFGILDPGDGQLTYVNAGHDPPMVLGDGGVRARLGPTAPALGLSNGAGMHVQTMRLAPGDTLFAYTDGVVDAMGEGEPFGEARLLALLAAPSASAAALLDTVTDALEAHVGTTESFDDVTTVAVRRLSHA
ncbi:PP2C family protein-serine/threonine phosphatase [Aerolutibacter ruishenii]|nr:SpoIIE family protein phosphatase [Lysobacter ruishenii]